MKNFKLDENPKISSGFIVPETYFDDFENKITKILPRNKEKVISLYRKPYFWISGIAALLIIGLSVSMFFKYLTDETFTNEDYISIHENLNTEDLAEFLTDNDIQFLEKTLIEYDIDSKIVIIENL